MDTMGILSIKLEQLNFSIRTFKRLKHIGVNCIGDLCQKNQSELLKIYGFGRKCLYEVENKLKQYNLALNLKFDNWKSIYEEPSVDTNGLSKLPKPPSADLSPILLQNVKFLDLSYRSSNCLEKIEIKQIYQLVQKSERDLLKIKNFGRKSLNEIILKLSQYNLELGSTVDLPLDGSFDNENKLIETLKKRLKTQNRNFLENRRQDQQEKYNSLNAELNHISEICTASQRNAEIIRIFYGWDGGSSKTLEYVGIKYFLTRERVRQIVNNFNRSFKEKINNTLFTPLLNKCIEYIQLNSLQPVENIYRNLFDLNLLIGPFQIESILKTSSIFGNTPNVFIYKIYRYEYIVNKIEKKILKNIVQIIKKNTSRYGMVNRQDLKQCVIEKIDENYNFDGKDNFIDTFLIRIPGLTFLDENRNWFFIKGAKRNRLINNIRKILSVCPEIHISDLRAGISRNYRMEGFSPPKSVLMKFCSYLEICEIHDQQVTLCKNLDFLSELGKNESDIISILQENENIMNYNDLRNQCYEKRMNENSFTIYLTYSPVISKFAPCVYGIRGTKTSPGKINSLKSDKQIGRVLKDYGYTNDGKIWLAYKLTESIMNWGVINIPGSLKRLLQGEYKLYTSNKTFIGILKIKKSSGWGFKAFLYRRGGDVGDYFAIEIDKQKQVAYMTIGNSEIIDCYLPEL